MIFKEAIIDWRKVAPWPDDTQVEQDCILTGMLHAIHSDPILKEKLALRGGTCLNKLFWKEPSRYSEDLDFVQTKSERIGPIVTAVRRALNPLFDQKPKWKAKKGSFHLYYHFEPEMRSGTKQRIKIEINTVETFSLEGHKQRELKFKSLWRSGEVFVTTFSLEEVLATKVRALYQRRKGRDLFDLWKARELKPDWKKVITMFLEYMCRSKDYVYRDLLKKNLQEKLGDSRFKADLSGLLLANTKSNFEFSKAATFVDTTIFSLVPESKNKRRQIKKKEETKK